MPSERQWNFAAKRLRLFWIFIVIAIPLMAFIVAYASGYRFDFNSKKILQSSALAIETVPTGAAVILNGQPAADSTPFISTISPGQYTIELQKSGYRAWKKQLVFEEGKSRIFPNVLLFAEQHPVARDPLPEDPAAEYTPLLALNDETQSLYREHQWLSADALRTIDGPWDVVVDTSTRTSYLMQRIQQFSSDFAIPSVVIDADWTKDSIAILATEYELLVFHPEEKELDVVYRQSRPLLDVVWHPDGGYVFFSDESGLYALELDDRDHRQLWQLSSLSSPTQLHLNARGDTISFISDRQWVDLRLYD